jgi:hypothetical protein
MPEMQIDGYALERLQEAKRRKGPAEEVHELWEEIHNQAEGREFLISSLSWHGGISDYRLNH